MFVCIDPKTTPGTGMHVDRSEGKNIAVALLLPDVSIEGVIAEGGVRW